MKKTKVKKSSKPMSYNKIIEVLREEVMVAMKGAYCRGCLNAEISSEHCRLDLDAAKAIARRIGIKETK